MFHENNTNGVNNTEFSYDFIYLFIQAWKRKWVCLHHMADITANKIVAILNMWQSSEHAETRRQDKLTISLENVTRIRRTKSKTHAHAFEIIEDEPVLYMAGDSETTSQAWIAALRRIFWPRQTLNKQLPPPGKCIDCFLEAS